MSLNFVKKFKVQKRYKSEKDMNSHLEKIKQVKFAPCELRFFWNYQFFRICELT